MAGTAIVAAASTNGCLSRRVLAGRNNRHAPHCQSRSGLVISATSMHCFWDLTNSVSVRRMIEDPFVDPSTFGDFRSSMFLTVQEHNSVF